MIKKSLLAFGFVAMAVNVQGQVLVFNENFDAVQTKNEFNLGWYQFINQEEGDDWSITSDAYKGAGALNFFNDQGVTNDNNWWRRAVKFRNLQLQEGKSYRLTWYLKGSNTYTDANGNAQKAKIKVGLMQGVENADVAIGDDATYTTIEGLNPDTYTRYSRMYFFGSKATQDAKYDEACAGKEEYAPENKDKYFATFNIYNPGDFYLDEVSLEETWVQEIAWNNEDDFGVIRVNFGYLTNAATLAKAAGGHVILPMDCVTVKVGNSVLTEDDILSVELREDGCLYIFTGALDGAPQVAFTNPEGSGLVYAGTLADEGAVKNFEEMANEDEDNSINATSSILEGPTLVTALPADGSSALDSSDLNEITVKFDKPVNLVGDEEHGTLVATMDNGETLEIATESEDGFAETITFKRTSTAELPNGTYTVTIKNIVNMYGNAGNDIVLTYEVGKDIADGIEAIATPNEEPVKVVYYDINGRMTTKPEDIAIKVATWANGFMKVSKVIVK